jgi:hypothetical protein
MRDLAVDAGAGLLFISHDLTVVRLIADRLAVMYRGRIVESGPARSGTTRSTPTPGRSWPPSPCPTAPGRCRSRRWTGWSSHWSRCCGSPGNRGQPEPLPCSGAAPEGLRRSIKGSWLPVDLLQRPSALGQRRSGRDRSCCCLGAERFGLRWARPVTFGT